MHSHRVLLARLQPAHAAAHVHTFSVHTSSVHTSAVHTVSVHRFDAVMFDTFAEGAPRDSSRA